MYTKKEKKLIKAEMRRLKKKELLKVVMKLIAANEALFDELNKLRGSEPCLVCAEKPYKRIITKAKKG